MRSRKSLVSARVVLASLAVLALGAEVAAAQSCLDQVRRMADEHGISTDPPSVAPGSNRGVTTQELGRSGGVIEPPRVDDKSVITPPRETSPGMPTMPDTSSKPRESARVGRTALQALLVAARARAMLSALESGRPPRLGRLDGVATGRRRDAAGHLHDQWLDFIAKRERLDGEIRRYGQALPLAAQRARDYGELAQTGDVSEHAWLELEQQRIDLEGQWRASRNQRAALIAETRKTAQDALHAALRTVAASGQDARRAAAHSERLMLTSPVDGTVQQLAAHTIGGAVPAAQPLMQIVPRQGVVEIEAFIENKDVGFVREGQAAEVKIDAFEYTKYGTIPATVSHVSRDAIQDEKRGLIYSVKVELARPAIQVEGRAVALAPGMSGSVEIKTGTRRVIEYVLSPLLQHGRESLHER